jgi:hypothetical protein
MHTNLQIPKELRRKIDRELQPGESIRWVEQPIPRDSTSTSAVIAFFSIPWTGFALFLMWGASGFKFPDLREGFKPQYLLPLFGVPFVVVGVGMLVTSLWKCLWTWIDARETVYLITNQRAISIQGSWSKTTIRSYSPDELKNIFYRERNDGTGDIVITIWQWKDSEGDLKSEEIGFLDIRNPREVEMILKQLAQGE